MDNSRTKTRETYQRWMGRRWVNTSHPCLTVDRRVLQVYLPSLDRWATVKVLQEPETPPSLP